MSARAKLLTGAKSGVFYAYVLAKMRSVSILMVLALISVLVTQVKSGSSVSTAVEAAMCTLSRGFTGTNTLTVPWACSGNTSTTNICTWTGVVCSGNLLGNMYRVLSTSPRSFYQLRLAARCFKIFSTIFTLIAVLRVAISADRCLERVLEELSLPPSATSPTSSGVRRLFCSCHHDLLAVILLLILVDLSNNNITGTLPSTIGLLTKLQQLCVLSHELHLLPTFISPLLCCIDRELGQNSLTGSIPSSVGSMSSLRYMYTFGETFLTFSDMVC